MANKTTKGKPSSDKNPDRRINAIKVIANPGDTVYYKESRGPKEGILERVDYSIGVDTATGDITVFSRYKIKGKKVSLLEVWTDKMDVIDSYFKKK